MEAWRAELYHHGIKGQRWGVRKGPPYPLAAKNHTAAEKRANWRQSLSEQAKRVIRRASKTADNEDESVKSKPKMSSKTKKILTTTAAVGALAVIGAVAISNPKVRELAKTGLNAANNALQNVANDPYAIKKGDGDFDILYKKHMKAMLAEDRQREKASKRSFERERRAQRKEQEAFFRNLQQQQKQADRDRKKPSSPGKLNSFKLIERLIGRCFKNSLELETLNIAT